MLRRVTCCSARHYRKRALSIGLGHVHQSRFRSHVLDNEAYYLVGLRYVEDNARRAGLVQRAEEWPWGSLWERTGGDRKLLEPSLIPLPEKWVELVNSGQFEAELAPLRSISRVRAHFPPVFPAVAAERYAIVGQPLSQAPSVIQP
jgi:putative transposase